MLLSLCLIAYLATSTKGIDLNTATPRTVCFPQDPPHPSCNTEFTDAYPQYSMSATNLTRADTFFMLFTRANPEVPENLHKCGGQLPPNTKYDPKKRLIVILNSFFIGYCDIAAFREWQKQILNREDANLLAVDLGWGTKVEEGTAELNQYIVAHQTAIIFRNIQSSKGLYYKNIYIISLSLGAQLAGLIGGLFHVGRITALDPAGPGYAKNETPLKDRLDRSDADLVDVWHTDMGRCLPDLGLDYDPGHVNFYVNGGHNQTGCYKYALISLAKGDFLYTIGFLLYPQLCFHSMVTEYFKVSVNPSCCQFVGVKCSSKASCKLGSLSKRNKNCGRDGEKCMIMGWDLDKYLKRIPTGPEIYYVETSNDCPYCINDQVQLEGFSETYNSLLQNTTCDKR